MGRHRCIRPRIHITPERKRRRSSFEPNAIPLTKDLRAWFDEDSAQSGSELLSRLQLAHPGAYPDGLLRTVQRRLKIWRAARATELVFGPNRDVPDVMAPAALRDVRASRGRGHQDPPVDTPSQNEILQEHLAAATN